MRRGAAGGARRPAARPRSWAFPGDGVTGGCGGVAVGVAAEGLGAVGGKDLGDGRRGWGRHGWGCRAAWVGAAGAAVGVLAVVSPRLRGVGGFFLTLYGG